MNGIVTTFAETSSVGESVPDSSLCVSSSSSFSLGPDRKKKTGLNSEVSRGATSFLPGRSLHRDGSAPPPVKNVTIDMKSMQIDVTVLVPLCEELMRSPYVLRCGYSSSYGVEGSTYSINVSYRDPFASDDRDESRLKNREEEKNGNGREQEEWRGSVPSDVTRDQGTFQTEPVRKKSFLHCLLQHGLRNLCTELSALEEQLSPVAGCCSVQY